MRQVPAKYTWASTLWTSRGGEVWRRHYNSVSGQWHWDEDGALEPSMGANGRMGFHLDNGFTPIETPSLKPPLLFQFHAFLSQLPLRLLLPLHLQLSQFQQLLPRRRSTPFRLLLIFRKYFRFHLLLLLLRLYSLPTACVAPTSLGLWIRPGPRPRPWVWLGLWVWLATHCLEA